MSAAGLRVYRHSGKFAPHGLLLPLIVGAVLAYPLGLVYSYLLRWVPFVFLNMLATVGYGFFFGWVTSVMLKRGHVRNLAVATVVSALVGLIALYGEWNGHLHALVRNPPWFFGPDEITRAMRVLYEEGSWGMKSGGNVTGIPLVIVWVVEALLIVGLTIALAWEAVRSTPYCEKSGRWLDDVKTINTLSAVTDPAHVAALAAGDIMPLTEIKPKAEGDNHFTRLTLKRSPAADSFCTVQLQDVSLTPQSDGKYQEKVSNLTGMLVLPAEMFQMVAEFAEFTPPEPAKPADPA